MRGSKAAMSSQGRAAVAAFAFALVLQSLAPPGYMAGSIEDGWPVVLCPEGLPSAFLGHAHHHHEHKKADVRPDMSLDGHCPLGGMLDATAELDAQALQAASNSTSIGGVQDYGPPLLQRRTTPRNPRAPPFPA